MSRDGGVDDTDLLLIDGDNLLHDVRGSRDEGGVAWLLPQLASWRPLHLRIVVGLDGHAAPGEASRTRATRGIEFHHAGRRSADDMLIALLEAQPYAGRSRTIVVTRDRALQARAAKAGGSSRSVDWLMRLVASGPRAPVAGPKPKLVGIGQGKKPRRRHYDPPEATVEDRSTWAPGRGATKKKGNPKRSPKGSGQR